MTLALRLAADRDLHDSRGEHAHLGILAWHAAGALDVRPDADAAQLTAPRGVFASLWKPGGVGELERLVEARDVVAGVVDGAGGRSIRERPDHVEAPQGDPIAAGLARGALDQPLDGVDALEAPDAAIHVDRHGVGEGALEPEMNRGDGVEPGHHALHVQDDRERHARGDVGAEVLRRMHAEGSDVTARIEGQLTREHVIARLRVGEEAFGPARRPLERTAEAARRPREGGVFGIGLDLRAEATADVGRHTAHALGGDAQDAREVDGQRMDALQRRVKRVALSGGVPLGEGRARLHEAGDEAVVEEREARDVGGGGDGARGGRGIPAFPVVAAVARDAGVQRRRAIGEGGDRVDDQRSHRVVDIHGVSTILRRRRRRRDDDRDGLADVTHPIRRQRIPRRLREWRSVAASDAAAPLRDQRRDRPDAIGHEIAPGEHAEHARDPCAPPPHRSPPRRRGRAASARTPRRPDPAR